ncbi:MAG: AP protein [Phycisphaerae bacterium]|nr:AP protein [Phycisphaerae bacterium]
MFGMILALAACLSVQARTPVSASIPETKTRNVFLVITDGLRWQEVFNGAEASLIAKEEGVEDPDRCRSEFWRDDPEIRRRLLMPFIWGEIASRGQIFGNREKGSHADVSNGLKFSYPGYAEAFMGFVDPSIDSNKKILNRNETVFEYLAHRPGFEGKVAAIAGWDVFPSIFNSERCGFLVNGGFDALTAGRTSPQIDLLNRLRADTPSPWPSMPHDSILAETALEWVGLNTPRVVFIGLGETDEWAHAGEYERYLRAARHADRYVERLWTLCQSTPAYKDRTTLIFTADHGRGIGKEWRDHGKKIDRAEEFWIAVMGPDTPPLGERSGGEGVIQAQIAATIAQALGEDYRAHEPRAAPPLPVFGPAPHATPEK